MSPGSSVSTLNVARELLKKADGMSSQKVFGFRTLTAMGQRVPVVLFENESGSVSARCVLASDDMPIIDGADQDEAMQVLESALEGILLARGIE